MRVEGLEPSIHMAQDFKSCVYTNSTTLASCLASPAGFEPATNSLEGYCSIQLSYGELILFLSYCTHTWLNLLG